MKQVLFAHLEGKKKQLNKVVIVCGLGHLDAVEEDEDFRWIYNDK